MLILMRRQNESVMIGDDVELKILSIDGKQIHIGFSAPKNVKIWRKEKWLEIQAEKGQK